MNQNKFSKNKSNKVTAYLKKSRKSKFIELTNVCEIVTEILKEGISDEKGKLIYKTESSIGEDYNFKEKYKIIYASAFKDGVEVVYEYLNELKKRIKNQKEFQRHFSYSLQGIEIYIQQFPKELERIFLNEEFKKRMEDFGSFLIRPHLEQSDEENKK